jgi:hypothetical protein
MEATREQRLSIVARWEQVFERRQTRNQIDFRIDPKSASLATALQLCLSCVCKKAPVIAKVIHRILRDLFSSSESCVHPPGKSFRFVPTPAALLLVLVRGHEIP